MNITVKNDPHQHSINPQLVFMWVYFLAVYLPFFVFMFTKYDVNRDPISVIGWYDGLHYLIVYLILTLPFCLYLLFFFNRYFIGNKKSINITAVVSCVFIAVGAFIPLSGTEIILLAHTIMSVSASIILMLTILFALILHAFKSKYKKRLLFLYGMYVAALLTGFYILYTAALFQFMATMSFFLILLLFNTTSVQNKVEKKRFV